MSEARPIVERQTSPATDPQTLRAIAHPVRMRLYELLVTGGPATAARLSAHVAGAPGSLSYHLHQLAEHGYVEEAPELGRDGRERWWRAVPGGLRWSPADFQDDPGAQEVLTAANRVLLGRQLERLHAWQAHGAETWGARWAEAAIATDIILELDPDELRELHDDLDALIRGWAERTRQRRTDPAAKDDRAEVFVFTHAFPIPTPRP